MNQVIVTRHPALFLYLQEIGLADHDSKVIEHATVEDVLDMDVIGVLPHSLSCHANTITEVPMRIPAELRGVELDIDQVRAFAGNPVTYQVKIIKG